MRTDRIKHDVKTISKYTAVWIVVSTVLYFDMTWKWNGITPTMAAFSAPLFAGISLIYAYLTFDIANMLIERYTNGEEQ